MAVDFLSFLSIVFGWVYFFCWSASFYPQPILNFRRRSTSGTTIDFPLINCLGFLAYLISNFVLYYSPLIRAQYAARHHGLVPTVAFNDIAFAAHALLLSLITTSQYLKGLWGFTGSGTVRPSRPILGIAVGCVVGVLVIIFVVLSSPDRNATDSAAARSWVWLDAAYAVSYVKLVVTLIKYTPQVIVNWRNKSTRGWSIVQILLDFSGGILSIAQLAIDSYLQRDWSGITGNPVKLALGNVSMIYDVIFMTQHYVLYRGNHSKDHETDALLGDGVERRRVD